MIDIVIIILFIVFAKAGYKSGLVRSLLTFVSSILALVCSFLIVPTVTEFLKDTFIYEWIYGAVSSKVGQVVFSGGIQSQGKTITENITWLPNVLTEQIKIDNNSAMYEALGVSNITEYVSKYITIMILGLVAVVMTWIVFKFVIGIGITIISTTVEHLPIIGTLNSQGGMIVGILKCALMLSIIGLIIPFFSGMNGFEGIILSIQSSVIGKFIYENNLIVEAFNVIMHS